MASTIEVFLAGLALIISTLAVITLIFVNTAFLGPLFNLVESINASLGGGPIPLSTISWFPSYVFFLTFVMWIVCIIAFVVVIGRRTVYDDLVD